MKANKKTDILGNIKNSWILKENGGSTEDSCAEEDGAYINWYKTTYCFPSNNCKKYWFSNSIETFQHFLM